MPYPSQINVDTLVAKAREIIEAEGVEQLSLSKLATALGVKAPSLYRYFESKAELLRAVNFKTSQELVAAMLQAGSNGDARQQFVAMARAAWDFAYVYPKSFQLLFTNASPELRPDESALVGLVLPLQAIITEISGEEQSLTALRGAYALINGFILFTLTGQFQRGGDLQAAFVQSVEAYLEGWRLLAIGD